MKPLGAILRSVSLMAASASLLMPGAFAAGSSTTPPILTDAPLGHIVVFKGDVDVDATAMELKRGYGMDEGMRYRHALKAIAGRIPPGQLERLRRNPHVAFIEPVQLMHLHAQTLPTGIDRINVELDPVANINNIDDRVDADIAIIDTGIDIDHPDLNVYRYVYCYQKNAVSGTCAENDIRADDTNGHGTHVAGSAAALDNNSGVVGVAPGARLWGIRVMRDDGNITTLEVIAAIDYVAAHASEIEVTNMSLGFNGISTALNNALDNVVNAGVTFVVSAGNDGVDVAGTSPGSNGSVITVSALADFDGKPGGLYNQTFTYSNCSENQDDSLACFSNYGSGVDIMAPGTKILSTYKGGGTATLHGTSMASPHVAGAATLYLSQHPGASPATVKAALLASADPAPCDTPSGICTDDPDGVQEPLLMVQPFADADQDGVSDQLDNCPYTANPGQQDIDGDGIGDACDQCPTVHDSDTSDQDLDGLTALQECLYGTNPVQSDTDSDGLLDGAEVNQWLTDPLLVDSDGDSFSDGLEVQLGTDPNAAGSYPPSGDGDLTGDGLVDVRDLLWAQQALLGSRTLDAGQQLRGDVAPLVNGSPAPDGVFNLGDLVVIQRKALGLIQF